MNRTRIPRIAVLAALGAVALAGCGGSSSDDAAEQIEAANSQAAVAASSIQAAASEAVGQAQSAASDMVAAASSMADQATAEAAAASSAAEEAARTAEEAASSASADTAEEEDVVEVAAPKGPYEKGGFAIIVQQLEDELGYSPEVLQVLLSADFAQFQVRDRKKPKNVDQYEWRGGEISDPVPVRLVGDGDLGENVFPLEALRTDVPAKLKKAGESISIEGAEVSTMIAQRMLPFTSDIRWLVNVSGTRENKQLRATTKGKVVETV